MKDGFSYSPEFGWFVCGAMVAQTFESGSDHDWAGTAIFGCFATVLLVLLIARWRRDNCHEAEEA